MAASSNAALLASLRRQDPSIQKVLHSCKFAALYELRRDLSWASANIGGPLCFVELKSGAAGSTKLIILNRQSLTNFVMVITGDVRIDIQKPYLFFQAGEGTVYGLWLHDPDDLASAKKMLKKLVNRVSEPRSKQSRASLGAPYADTPQEGRRKRKSGGGSGGGGASSTPSQKPLSPDFFSGGNGAADAPATPAGRRKRPSKAGSGAAAATSMTSSLLTPDFFQKSMGRTRGQGSDSKRSGGGGSKATPPALSRSQLQLFLQSLVQDDEVMDLVASKYAQFRERQL